MSYTVKRKRTYFHWMLVERRLQEMGQASNVPLNMCFIDRHEANESAHRTFLCEVLARLGVPPRMMTFCIFHDGIRARLQLNGANINVVSRLPGTQTRLPFIPAAVHPRRNLGRRYRKAIRRDPNYRLGLMFFLDDAPIGDDDEHVEETPRGKIRRVMWLVLHADDAGVVSRTSDGLSRMMAVMVVTCQEFGQMVSESKTESTRPG